MQDFHYKKDFFSFEELLNELTHLSKNGYVFRGESNHIWPLKSKALRTIASKYCFKNLEKFNAYTERYRYSNLGDILIKKTDLLFNYKILKRFFKLAFFICVYNFELTQFHKKNLNKTNIEYFYEKFQNIAYKDFESAVAYLLWNVMTVFDMDCNLIKPPFCPTDRAAYEEETPQHYGLDGTALLDLSYDPNVALYFASDGSEGSDFIVVYALKEIRRHSNNLFRLDTQANRCLRKDKQKGLFLECVHLNLYFLNEGESPDAQKCLFYQVNEKIEGILPNFKCSSKSEPNFDLKRFVIPIAWLSIIKLHLEKNNINSKTLGLDEPL